MNPRIAPGNREPADPLPATPPAGGSSPDAATPDARASQDPAASPLSARLSAALVRPFAGASARLARLVPSGEASSGSGQVTPDGAAAYQEALREAFRSAAPLEPARAAAPPAAELEATPEAVANTSEADTRVTQPTFAVAPLVANTPEAIAPPSTPPAFPPAGGPPPDVRAGSRARTSGPTAADDFFGGLVRRVERRP